MMRAPSADSLPALGWVMLAVAVLLLAEAVAVAWRFRRESPPLIWRRKLVLIPAVLAILAVLLAFQVWNLYGQYMALLRSFPSWAGTVSPFDALNAAISSAAWLCGMLIFTAVGLLAVGAYHLLAAD